MKYTKTEPTKFYYFFLMHLFNAMSRFLSHGTLPLVTNNANIVVELVVSYKKDNTIYFIGRDGGIIS